MPLEDVVAMYWRVKKWRYTFDIYWSEDDPILSVFSYSNERELYPGQSSLLIQSQEYDGNQAGEFVDLENSIQPEWDENNDEKFLICRTNGQKHFSHTKNIVSIRGSGGTLGASAGTGFQTSLEWNFPTPPAFARTATTGEDEFLPTVRFQATTLWWNRIYASKWTFDPANIFPINGTYGTFSYNFLGKTYSTDIYAYNPLYTGSAFGYTLSINASLEAIEYWPYDPKDGFGPIYDKDTGAQLRPFPNL